MSFRDRMINFIGMGIGATVGITVGYIIYKRTMARAAELALEDGAEEEGRSGGYSSDNSHNGNNNIAPYLDNEDTLLDPEDAAALMTGDDMSLWETQVDNDEESEGSQRRGSPAVGEHKDGSAQHKKGASFNKGSDGKYSSQW